jgi:hypothetical protein
LRSTSGQSSLLSTAGDNDVFIIMDEKKELRLDSFDDGIRNIYGVQAEVVDKSWVQYH